MNNISHKNYVNKIIIAELIQGAKSNREISIIEGFLEAFYIIDQKENTWIKTGKVSYEMRKKGKAANLMDCYMATIAKEHNCKIFTFDIRFKEIQKITNIELIR